VNGIGQSAAALSRALGPMAGAPLFAWSADNGRLGYLWSLVII